MHDPVFPNGTAVCEVEVDPDTGRVDIVRYASIDDVGRGINPLIVHGQTHGAIVQGVGQAMWEQFYTDPDSGQPFTGSLMDYGMPRADGVPSFTCEIAEVLSPTNPLGIKAGGEGGTTGAPAAVVSAIVDALSVYGIRNITMPATPYTIWKAIQEAKACSAAHPEEHREAVRSSKDGHPLRMCRHGSRRRACARLLTMRPVKLAAFVATNRRIRQRFRRALISSNRASARSNFSLNSHIAARISR